MPLAVVLEFEPGSGGHRLAIPALPRSSGSLRATLSIATQVKPEIATHTERTIRASRFDQQVP